MILLEANDPPLTGEISQGVDDQLEIVASETAALLYFDGRQSSFRFLGEEIENFLFERPLWGSLAGRTPGL